MNYLDVPQAQNAAVSPQRREKVRKLKQLLVNIAVAVGEKEDEVFLIERPITPTDPRPKFYTFCVICKQRLTVCLGSRREGVDTSLDISSYKKHMLCDEHKSNQKLFDIVAAEQKNMRTNN